MGTYGNYPNPDLCKKYGCAYLKVNYMSCEGCLTAQKAIEEALSSIRIKAKQYAIENDTNVYIYETLPGEFAFMAEAAAKENGIIPTRGIVSRLQPSS